MDYPEYYARKAGGNRNVVHKGNTRNIMERENFELRRAQCHRTLIRTIRKRQLLFLGHTWCQKSNPDGKVEGNMSRGQQRITFMDSPSVYTQRTLTELCLQQTWLMEEEK